MVWSHLVNLNHLGVHVMACVKNGLWHETTWRKPKGLLMENNTPYESNNIFLDVIFLLYILCIGRGNIFDTAPSGLILSHSWPVFILRNYSQFANLSAIFLKSAKFSCRWNIIHTLSPVLSDKTIKSEPALGHLIIIICTDPRSQIGSNLIVKDTAAVPRVKRGAL